MMIGTVRENRLFAFYASFPYRLYSPSHLFGYFQKHIVQFAGMNTFLILGILLIGILLGLVKVMRDIWFCDFPTIVDPTVRPERNHPNPHHQSWSFQGNSCLYDWNPCSILQNICPRVRQYRFYVDGTEQRSKSTLPSTQLICEDSKASSNVRTRCEKDHIAGKARIGDRAITELTLLQYIPQGINLPVHHFGTSLIA